MGGLDFCVPRKCALIIVQIMEFVLKEHVIALKDSQELNVINRCANTNAIITELAKINNAFVRLGTLDNTANKEDA